MPDVTPRQKKLRLVKDTLRRLEPLEGCKIPVPTDPPRTSTDP